MNDTTTAFGDDSGAHNTRVLQNAFYRMTAFDTDQIDATYIAVAHHQSKQLVRLYSWLNSFPSYHAEFLLNTIGLMYRAMTENARNTHS